MGLYSLRKIEALYYTGEWRYHNHAYQTGSITVTELP